LMRGGIEGQATDIAIQAKEILRLKSKLSEILVENTGQTRERIDQDTERDYYMSSIQGKEYGLIDHVIEHRTKT